jgi:hypothetical protein
MTIAANTPIAMNEKNQLSVLNVSLKIAVIDQKNPPAVNPKNGAMTKKTKASYHFGYHVARIQAHTTKAMINTNSIINSSSLSS